MLQRPVIRASDLADFLFCEQAWWYRCQGIPSQNRAALHAGRDTHRRHARRVARWLRVGKWAIVLIVLGLLLLGLFAVLRGLG